MAKILLVEDEMLVRELAFEDLSDAGHEVIAAGSGDEALAILRRDLGFDVLFTDIRMPGESGLELLQKAKERHSNVPVIIMTAYSDLESAVAAFQGVGGLAAHPCPAGSEGDRPAGGEGDDEGNGGGGRPFARAARAAGTGEQVQARGSCR